MVTCSTSSLAQNRKSSQVENSVLPTMLRTQLWLTTGNQVDHIQHCDMMQIITRAKVCILPSAILVPHAQNVRHGMDRWLVSPVYLLVSGFEYCVFAQ